MRPPVALAALVFLAFVGFSAAAIRNPCNELDPLPWNLSHLPSWNLTKSNHFSGTFKANFTRPFDFQPSIRFKIEETSIFRFYLAGTTDDIDITVFDEATNNRIVRNHFQIVFIILRNMVQLFPQFTNVIK